MHDFNNPTTLNEALANPPTKETVPMGTRPDGKSHSPTVMRIFELASRPDGATLEEINANGKDNSSTLKRLFDLNMLARHKSGRQGDMNYRYFTTYKALAEYSQRKTGLTYGMGNHRIGLSEKGTHALSHNGLFEGTTSNQRSAFEGEATVDYSKAKITRIPTPDIPMFRTTYVPGEKEKMVRRFDNNLLHKETTT